MQWSERVLVKRATRCLVLILGLTLFASCATSPVATQPAQTARSNAQPWDPGYHDDPSGFNSRDLVSLLNGLTGLAGR
jgi:hypothetical protein